MERIHIETSAGKAVAMIGNRPDSQVIDTVVSETAEKAAMILAIRLAARVVKAENALADALDRTRPFKDK